MRKGAGTAGRVNWSVERSAMGEANERRKRAELRNSCRAIADPSIEDRISLIFCFNLAQRNGLNRAREARFAILRRQTSSTGPTLKRQRTCTRSTALQNWALQHSCPLAQPRPLAIFGVETTPARSPEKMQQPLC
jgi:hypothetical protein